MRSCKNSKMHRPPKARAGQSTTSAQRRSVAKELMLVRIRLTRRPAKVPASTSACSGMRRPMVLLACVHICVCVMHLSLCMCGGLGGTYFLFCATDRSDWILFVCHAYMFCTYFINQAYLVGQKHAITTWLRKGCVEKGQGGSILTIAVSLKYAMRPE